MPPRYTCLTLMQPYRHRFILLAMQNLHNLYIYRCVRLLPWYRIPILYSCQYFFLFSSRTSRGRYTNVKESGDRILTRCDHSVWTAMKLTSSRFLNSLITIHFGTKTLKNVLKVICRVSQMPINCNWIFQLSYIKTGKEDYVIHPELQCDRRVFVRPGRMVRDPEN